MQIIQTIREKGGPIIIAAIALALIAFILMDAKQDKGGVSASESIGKVNGSRIDQAEFYKKQQNVESQEEQQTGQKPTTQRISQIREQVWNQIVAEKVFYAEAAKLGIEFTSKELDKILKSDDPTNPLTQDRSMVDPATGKLDMAKVAQALGNIKKAKGEQWEMINSQIIEPQKLTSVSTKYFALLNASAYYPTWMEEKDAKENKTFATISYVQIPYQSVSDTSIKSIKVTDDEIKKYIEKHKGLFKQEAGRMISYVAFSQLPSVADSAKTKEEVEKLRAEFATTTNMSSFLARNSSIDFDTNYVPKSRIQSRFVDSITKLPAGSVYGPYVENKSYVLAKMMGSKNIFDTVKARHILIGTIDPKTGQPVMEDSVAKKRADSILAAINAGADFRAMVQRFSTDEGSKNNGGEYPSITYGQMVPEFNKFCFEKPVGSKGVVKTQFGYHIIEVLGQKGSSPAYKIGFLAKDIYASETTINNASNKANELSILKDAKKMDEYLQKNGLQKITVPTIIKENDAAIGQMQDARQLVRWIFEAKKGDVSDPMPVGDQFVVATVDKIYEEGTQDVETARAGGLVENAIREEKKAEQIISALGANPTLEGAAAKYAKEIKMAGADSSITLKSSMIDSIGYETKLVGAIFNKANLNKVSTVAGKAGVFVFKVNGIGEKATDPNEDKVQMRLQQTTALRNQAVANWFEGLRKKATIKDNRAKFF